MRAVKETLPKVILQVNDLELRKNNDGYLQDSDENISGIISDP